MYADAIQNMNLKQYCKKNWIPESKKQRTSKFYSGYRLVDYISKQFTSSAPSSTSEPSFCRWTLVRRFASVFLHHFY